ncbi:MAG TPA: amidohydrolase [Chitinophagaceae bacterium]|nr:amidohydrolase [Chitinophagaceae bacterium]
MKYLFYILLFIISTNLLKAQNKTTDLVNKISVAADKIESKCIDWRRDIHQHPELGNNEFRTAKLIADHLRSLGIDVQEGVGKTGVVGVLKGDKPGPCIGLRADMDALPVVERVDLPFASKVKSTYNGQEVGVMHACGHDTHVAILMSVAEILAGMKKELKGVIKFVFQPAEEGPPEGEEGGAPLMIKEGVLENPKVDVMFGLHIGAQTDVGKINYRSGGTMAASDWFTIKVKGKQTHGSQPWGGIDPVVVSAQIVNGLQTIVSRQTDLTKNAAVISVSTIHGGVRSNIIPEDLIMTGTIRTLDTVMQNLIHQKIKLTASKIAEASGATAETIIEKKTLVTYNDPVLTKQMLPSFIKAAGESNVEEVPAITGAEDFSFFAEKVPSLFFFIGGKQKGVDPEKVFPHHTPDFWIDESGMKTGIKAFCNLVFDYMNMPPVSSQEKGKKPF